MKLQPQQSSSFETRLIWMSENQPNLLKELYESGELKQHILDKVSWAAKHYLTLLKNGVDEKIAKEIELSLLAPTEGMGEEKEPMDEDMFEKIFEEVTRREDDEAEE